VSAPAGPWRLVVADLDGTLVTGTSACIHLDEWIGHGPVVAGLERRLAAGELTSTEVAERYAPHYRGVALAEAAAALASIPVLDDVAPGVDLLGDGGSDLPLFRAVGFSVALNASPAARDAASVTVDSRSFLDALAAVPGLLERPIC
jgi:phosphoserine phosphatase